MYKREIKIVLKNDNDKNIAKTYYNGSQWYFIGVVGRWCDTVEEAFDYEFCDDAHGALFYEELKSSIESNLNEIEEAYKNEESEYAFYF